MNEIFHAHSSPTFCCSNVKLLDRFERSVCSDHLSIRCATGSVDRSNLCLC